MIHIKSALKRTPFGLAAALFLLSAVFVAIPTQTATAASLIDRSLAVSSTRGGDEPAVGAGNDAAPAGTGANGQQVGHTYVFQTQTGGSVGAISFQYCSSPFGYLAFDTPAVGSCGAATGFTSVNAGSAKIYIDSSRAAVEASTTVAQTWTRDVTANASSSDSRELVVSGTAIAPTAGQYVKVIFDATAGSYFKNPNAAWTNPNGDGTYFAHVELHTNTASYTGDTAPIDEGTVTNSVADIVSISTRVQETLRFSVGGQDGAGSTSTSLAANDPTGTCAALTGTSQLTMGDDNFALNASTESKAKSYVRLSTNSSSGARVFYSGETLESTADDIIAAQGATSDVSDPGSEQFGLTVLDSDGANNVAGSQYEDYSQLVRTTEYADPAEYAFDTTSATTPVEIANSAGGIVTCDTLPVEYVANISPDTPAGLYSTKISYIAVPAY